MPQSTKDIQQRCKEAKDLEEAAKLHEELSEDKRAGVVKALGAMDKRLAKEEAEKIRVSRLYEYESEMRRKKGCVLSVGLDEVGRGPLAGPVAIGAVVYDSECEPVWGINDSKKLSDAKRKELSEKIKEEALAYDVIFVSAAQIDEIGIAAALRKAFIAGIESIEKQLEAMGRKEELGLVVLDGNPMHLDEREVNVIKGDAKVASISSASIIAKVARDAYMEELDGVYPSYGFAGHKGYGAPSHIEAIKEHGLCPEHRASFCKNFV